MNTRHIAPIWLMGLSNSTFGFYGGFITFSLPQLLAEQHVPEARLAAITAAVASPGFYAFLLSPMLDVRFSRRWYATFFAALAAIFLAVSIANVTNVPLLEACMLLGFLSVCLSTSALGGWLSTVTPKEEENRLSSWYNVANIGCGGLMALVAAEIIHLVTPWLAACLLGAFIFLPTVIFLFIPAPGPDRRLAAESFRDFFREVLSLLRRRQVLIALLLFGAPASTFTLTNILGGLGNDFHCSAHLISLLGGAGMAAAGFFGSLLFPILAKRLALRPLYLAIGAVGCLFTLSLVLFPHTPSTYAVGFIGENVFQSLAFTGLFAISFETIGRDNPLAATTFSLLNASAMVPIVYMQVVDGRAYEAGGIAATFAVDAGIGIVACLLLALLLGFLRRKPAQTAPIAELVKPLE
jgi:PAT family beta-lactamase induction signal transducer AmpG